MKLTILLLCCLGVACSTSKTCTITKVCDKTKTYDNEECRKYRTTTGTRWILESEAWSKGDTISGKKR